MTEFYHADQRGLQDQFGTRRLADRLNESLVHATFSPSDREFIERQDMFFLATVDADGHANCSYRGGAPGFVRVIDDATLVFPNYDGNGMYLSMGNVQATRQIGMLFIDFENPRRLRVNGSATMLANDPLLASYPEAQFIVRVTPREIFDNCPRYIHRRSLVARSEFTPAPGQVTPVPAWKRGDWVADVLPENDPARDPARPAK